VDLKKTSTPNTYPNYIVPVGQITSKMFVCNPNKGEGEQKASRKEIKKIYFGKVYAQSLMGEEVD
jgi:hypothetical protein